jgi:hypothetical protein
MEERDKIDTPRFIPPNPTFFLNSLEKSKISSGNSWNYCINNAQTFGLGYMNNNSLTSGKLVCV